jgi:hypothetical protein
MADAAPPKPSSSVKLVLLGEAAVGKSSLVMRFVNNDFQENKEPTIGGEFSSFPPHPSTLSALSPNQFTYPPSSPKHNRRVSG